MVLKSFLRKSHLCHYLQKMRHSIRGTNSIRQRFQKHLKDIEHATNWTQAPPSYLQQGKTNVGRHFSKKNHTAQDVTIQVLELIRANHKSPTAQSLRLERENYWMHLLKTIHPLGLNATDGSNHTRPRPNTKRPQRRPTHLNNNVSH